MPRPPEGHDWVVLEQEQQESIDQNTKPKWRQCRRCRQLWARRQDRRITLLKCDDGVVQYIQNC